MSLELALDAFESVKQSPGSSPLWHHLSYLVQALEPDARAQLVHAIANYTFSAPQIRWLQYSALACLSGDHRWLVQQAALADSSTPSDAIMTLLGLAWFQALTHSRGRSSFIDTLQGIDAPRLQRLAAQHMHWPTRTVHRVPGQKLRVALYTPQLSENEHGGTTLTLNIMSALSPIIGELHAFSAQEVNIPAISSYHGGHISLMPLAADPAKLNLKGSGQADISLPNTLYSLRVRFQQLLQAIDTYNPDVIIFVGLMSPMVFKLYERYPIVALSVHALAPVTPVDVWLSAAPETETACWPALPVPQAMDFPFRFWPTATQQVQDQQATGLPTDGTLLVTIGFRLDQEISSPWREQMLDFLDQHPDTHWLLLGVNPNVPMHDLPRHSRVLRAPPVTNLQAWLKDCDICVNPPRLGGGGSVAMAMEQGLAVISHANGDGGDKVGAYAQENDEAYFSLLTQWVKNPESRRQAGDELKHRFHERLDFSGEKPPKRLLEACHLAINAFQQRKAALHA